MGVETAPRICTSPPSRAGFGARGSAGFASGSRGHAHRGWLAGLVLVCFSPRVWSGLAIDDLFQRMTVEESWARCRTLRPLRLRLANPTAAGPFRGARHLSVVDRAPHPGELLAPARGADARHRLLVVAAGRVAHASREPGVVRGARPGLRRPLSPLHRRRRGSRGSRRRTTRSTTPTPTPRPGSPIETRSCRRSSACCRSSRTIAGARRRRLWPGVLAWGAFALALLSAEAGLAIAGYTIAYAACFERAGEGRARRRSRALSLVPTCSSSSSGALAYRALGHGAMGSGANIDPAASTAARS